MIIEPFYYCKNGNKEHPFYNNGLGGIGEICSKCARNPLNSPYEIKDITNWYDGMLSTNGKRCADYISMKN